MVDFRRLSIQCLLAIATCAFGVVLCYYFIDRQVAIFVHDHQLAKVTVFHWLTLPPPLVQKWAPVVLLLLAASRGLAPWQVWQQTLFLALASVIVADQFRESLGDVCGRYWPETWHDNNPSLIMTGAYGFNPFHLSNDTGSFPSGHSARISGFFSVLWLMMPRGRWVYAVIALPMLMSLVAMNYHFVGDVLAGSMIGSLVGIWATKLFAVCEKSCQDSLLLS